MFLSLPTVIFDDILSRLNLRDKRLLTHSSKELANDIWRRLPAVHGRYSEAEHTHTMGLFQSVESVMPSDPLITQMTKIVRNTYRNPALIKWIRKQGVCIDAGGFYTPNRGYRDATMERIRIRLWDRPIGFKRNSYHDGMGGGWDTTPFLRREFLQMEYNP